MLQQDCVLRQNSHANGTVLERNLYVMLHFIFSPHIQQCTNIRKLGREREQKGRAQKQEKQLMVILEQSKCNERAFQQIIGRESLNVYNYKNSSSLQQSMQLFKQCMLMYIMISIKPEELVFTTIFSKAQKFLNLAYREIRIWSFTFQEKKWGSQSKIALCCQATNQNDLFLLRLLQYLGMKSVTFYQVEVYS